MVYGNCCDVDAWDNFPLEVSHAQLLAIIQDKRLSRMETLWALDIRAPLSSRDKASSDR